jgi:hypothetical protein
VFALRADRATDDDGERMICVCDSGHWMHSRCMGIPDSVDIRDSEAVPHSNGGWSADRCLKCSVDDTASRQ